MEKSVAAKAMDDVQSTLRPFFKQHGFRMRARTCNRGTPDGLTQVINFQMGRFDPPGIQFIPVFRENRYGSFTVNAGIYVPEIALAEHYWVKPGSFAQEVDCCIRVRLGQLAGESDIWWNLPASEETLTDLRTRFERDVFPFFLQLEDRESILIQLEHGRGSFSPRIPRAIILAARGEREKARDLLIQQIRSTEDPKHVEYVQQIAGRIGLGRIEF